MHQMRLPKSTISGLCDLTALSIENKSAHPLTIGPRPVPPTLGAGPFLFQAASLQEARQLVTSLSVSHGVWSPT